MGDKRIKVVVAKPGLDGHDRGAKVVALALKEAGMEVIYTGLHQSVDSIVNTAIQEDADIIGLSVMTGGHLHICKEVVERLKEEGAGDIKVAVGGVIPSRDIPALKDMGVVGIFPGGTPIDEAIAWMQANVN
ncbi:MAG: cobalamin B12-binding domain-containing protein [Gaiellales bacterium]|nr:cobalamin B12-binding domain-containing protein [Gaiellales bacterium]